MKKIKKRIKLSITIESDIYKRFDEKIKENCIDKSLLFDKFIIEWLNTK
jgi:hypothetical protein